jgi:AcrR family transcriptional regulator
MSKISSREKLLEAAGFTFSKFGYYKTSMEDIAENAQKAKGSIYYHFGSKELLFEAVVFEELKGLTKALAPIFNNSEADTRETLKKYMVKRMAVLRNAPNYQETLRPSFYEHYDFVNNVKNQITEWEIDQIKKLIDSGIEKGELELPGDRIVYAQVLVMLLQGLEPNFFLRGEYDRLESHFDNLINIITKGISK